MASQEEQAAVRQRHGPPMAKVVPEPELTDEQVAQHLLRASRALDVQVQRSARRRAGREAGLDALKWFYSVPGEMLTLAVREDFMKAYVTSIRTGISVYDIEDQLKQFHVADPHMPQIAEITASLERNRWVLVAEGREPRGTKWTQYLLPGQPDKAMSRDELFLMSNRLYEALAVDKLDPEILEETRAFAALPGEEIARVRTQPRDEAGADIFGNELPVPEAGVPNPEAGDGVTFADDLIKADKHGYVYLVDNRLSVVSPFWLDSDAIRLHWCLLDRRRRAVTREMVQTGLDDLQVTEGVKEEEIASIIERLTDGGKGERSPIIAEGQAPEHGADTRLDFKVEIERDVGDIDEEGQFQFNEEALGPNVQPGQLIATLIPPTAGTDGKSVRGEVREANQGSVNDFEPGTNVEVRLEDGTKCFYAKSEGVARLSGNRVHVWEVLTITGDVSFSTGNLDFRGTIVVKGSIRPGFGLKATGDVIVTGSVEPGGKIVAQGKVLVGKGFTGRKTRVTSLGDVNTQYVHESTVQSAGTIHIRNYAQQAFLRASHIKVYTAEGQRGGSLFGGETWALRSVDAVWLGNTANATTAINAGMDLAQAEKLEDFSVKVSAANRQIAQLLQKFSMDKVDVAQIQHLLAASSGPRRKVLARAAQQLGQAVQIQQGLLKEKKDLEERASKSLNEATVSAWQSAYPNTKIIFGQHLTVLKDEISSPRFHLRDGELVER